jgi:hypothetical protein
MGGTGAAISGAAALVARVPLCAWAVFALAARTPWPAEMGEVFVERVLPVLPASLRLGVAGLGAKGLFAARLASALAGTFAAT